MIDKEHTFVTLLDSETWSVEVGVQTERCALPLAFFLDWSDPCGDWTLTLAIGPVYLVLVRE